MNLEISQGVHGLNTEHCPRCEFWQSRAAEINGSLVFDGSHIEVEMSPDLDLMVTVLLSSAAAVMLRNDEFVAAAGE